MFRVVSPLTICALLGLFAPESKSSADEATPLMRGVFVKPGRVTPEFLAAWKTKGVTAVIVPLDDVTKRRWEVTAGAVEHAGMSLWPWVEVARNLAMADEHPEWMAATGGHHDDWRKRFPKAPAAKAGEVVKAWPWVPIGYLPTFDAHRERLRALLSDLPGKWSGVFLNDLQAGPSSCGCGNDQCRWALDYGSPSTAPKTPGDDAAARMVAEILARHPGKAVVPVWVTECEAIDLPSAKDSTGLCGRVSCAKGDCWPRYARNWNPLVKATAGPIGLALWPETFRRDSTRWMETAPVLFQEPPRDATPLARERTIEVVQAWEKSDATVDGLLGRVKEMSGGWVLVLDPIDQSWEPRAVSVPGRR